MGSLADVFVAVHAKTDAMDAELRAAGARAGTGAGQSFGGSFGSMLRSAVVGVAAIAAGSGLLSLGTMGIKAAADMQQAQVAFTTLIGNAAKAKAFLGDLQAFAKATPFELPGLVDNARLLLGVGVAAKDVIPTLTAWGNAAGALGLSQDRFNGALLAVTQSMGAGKINAQDMNQIINAGIPIWRLMSEATGKSQAQLRKLSSEGKLLSADILPKVQAQMQKDYGGAMAAQSQTLAGVWSTLMDTLRIGMANSITPLIPVLSKLVPEAAAVLSNALAIGSKAAQDFIAHFGAGWASGAGAGAGEIQQLGNAAHLVFEWLRDNGPKILSALGTAFSDVVVAVADVVRWFNQHRDIAITLGVVIATLTIAEQLNAAAVFVTSGALTAKVAALTLVKGAMAIYNATQLLMNSTLVTWLGVQALDAAAWVAKVANIIATTVALAAYNVGIGIAKAATAAWTAIQWLANGSALAWLGTQALDLAAWLGKVSVIVANTAALVAYNVAMLVVKGATLVWTGVQWLLNAAMTANPIGLIIVGIGLLVVAIIWVATKTHFFQDVWNNTWTFLKEIGAWFAGPFAHFFVSTWSAIVSAFVSAKNAVTSAWDSVTSFFSSIPGRILGFFSGLAGQFTSIGSNIIQGIINGVEGAVGGLVSAAANAAKSAFNAAKSALGISSPSKVFRDGVGRPMVQGAIAGIQDMEAQLHGQIRATFGGTPGTAGAAVSGSAGSTGGSTSTVNFSPTYNVGQPVDEQALARSTVTRLMFALNTGAAR